MNTLTDDLRAALNTSGVSLELTRNLFGGQALIRVTVPGPTPRAKRPQPVPVIVGDPGQSHAAMLRLLADVLDDTTV